MATPWLFFQTFDLTPDFRLPSVIWYPRLQRKAIEKKRMEEKKFGAAIGYDSEYSKNFLSNSSSGSSSPSSSQRSTFANEPVVETKKYVM